MSVGFLYTSVFSVLPHLVITVPRNGMEPSCSSSMVKDKLGWTLLSTWTKSVADSALGILTRVSSTYLR